MKRGGRGFTVVELLIVIVVIAIIAVISILAFNGIQQRARNSQTASAVKIYHQALQLFAADNDGNYPALDPPNYPANTYFICVGEGYPSNECWRNASTAYYENDTFNALLKTQLGSSIPMPGLSPARYYTGILYIPESASIVNPAYRIDGGYISWLAYAIEANNTTTRCPVGPIATFNGTTFISTPPASGQTTAGSATANPTCWVPLRK